MSKLSRAVKRLKGKLKQTKHESAPSVSSISSRRESRLLLPEPLPQSTKAASSVKKVSEPESTFTNAALQPGPKPALIESHKETQYSELQRKLLHAEDLSIVPKASDIILRRLYSAGKAPAVNAQRQSAPKPTFTAPTPKRKPLLNPTVTAPKPKPQPTPKATPPAPAPKPAPKPKPQPTPKATPSAPNPTPKGVSTPKPAVQTHAGLYSGFTPSVAQVDQSTPRTLYQAQRTARDVLHDDSPAGLTSRALASRSPYSSRPIGLFQTGGALGGGQYSSTGGAFGGGVVTQTGGSFGEGSVTQTGGSLGEAWAIRNFNVG